MGMPPLLFIMRLDNPISRGELLKTSSRPMHNKNIYGQLFEKKLNKVTP
jgi:hypothetical protein